MQELISNVVEFLTVSRASGEIRPTDSPTAQQVWRGYPLDQMAPPLTAMPAIIIEDGGEKTTDNINNNTQTRTYSIIIELMLKVVEVETALDEILGFSSEVKAAFEKLENKQLDGMIFGSQITPLIVGDEKSGFVRGRRIIIEYDILENTYERF